MNLKLTDKQVEQLQKNYRFVQVVEGKLLTMDGDEIEIPNLPPARKSVVLYENQLFDLREFG